jgi:YhcH/YjgK/YiaL family protein
MQLVDDLSKLDGLVDRSQQDLISQFLMRAYSWTESRHGEKTKLEGGLNAVFIAAEGTAQWKGILEAHRNFYDLHCTIAGNDTIAIKPVNECIDVEKDYQSEDDYILYKGNPSLKLQVPAGYFCLVTPDDAHMALYGECGFVRKVVFKIPVTNNAA